MNAADASLHLKTGGTQQKCAELGDVVTSALSHVWLLSHYVAFRIYVVWPYECRLPGVLHCLVWSPLVLVLWDFS